MPRFWYKALNCSPEKSLTSNMRCQYMVSENQLRRRNTYSHISLFLVFAPPISETTIFAGELKLVVHQIYFSKYRSSLNNEARSRGDDWENQEPSTSSNKHVATDEQDDCGQWGKRMLSFAHKRLVNYLTVRKYLLRKSETSKSVKR